MFQAHAKIIGYLGLLPFIVLPFFILWDTVSYYEGLSFYKQYSAIILSFLSGIIWCLSVVKLASIRQLYLSALPCLLAWFCIAISPDYLALTLLSLSYLLILIYEFHSVKLPAWYRSLRIRLTAIAIGGHLMMIWLMYKTG